MGLPRAKGYHHLDVRQNVDQFRHLKLNGRQIQQLPCILRDIDDFSRLNGRCICRMDCNWNRRDRESNSFYRKYTIYELVDIRVSSEDRYGDVVYDTET